MVARVAGVTLTHPDRVLYPEQGVTKLDLAGYYEDVGARMLRYVARRPLTLVRCPQGREGPCFFQKHVGDVASPHVHGVRVRERDGMALYVFIDDVPGLVALVQIGVLELHPWGSRNDDIERPDRMVFDLDPGPGVPWETTVRAAHEIRERLARLDLVSFPRLTGGRGLHVVVPLDRRAVWSRVAGFARAVAEAMAADAPHTFVVTASKERREGRIFVDYLRNTRGATAVASYSTRARPGAPVATPLRWDEVTVRMAGDRYSITSVRRRLAALASDPWSEFFDVRQSITQGAEARVAGRG